MFTENANQTLQMRKRGRGSLIQFGYWNNASAINVHNDFHNGSS